MLQGPEKQRSQSEERGDHIGGVENQQNSLGGTAGCSVRQGDHLGGVFTYRGFTVLAYAYYHSRDG